MHFPEAYVEVDIGWYAKYVEWWIDPFLDE